MSARSDGLYGSDAPLRGADRSGLGLTFSPAATTPATTTPAASTDPFSMFSDPATNFLTQIIKGQIGSLASAPATDPFTASLVPFLTKQMTGLSSAAPVSFDASNGLLGQFAQEGQQRIAELNQAPFTDAQEQALQTKTRNDLAVQRDQAKTRLMEDASRRGLGQSSGIVGQEISNLEGQTTAADAKNQNDLMLWIADQVQQRKNQAATISGQLAQAGQADAGMRLSAQTASENANSNRTGQIVGIATALANMAAQQRGEARARQGDITQLASVLAELPVQRLELASTILNGNTVQPSSIFNDTYALNNAQTNQNQYANAADAQFIGALSQLASYFANKK